MNEEEKAKAILFLILIPLLLGILFSILIVKFGNFNSEFTEELSNRVCELTYHTKAVSYENKILVCENVHKKENENYVLDFN